MRKIKQKLLFLKQYIKQYIKFYFNTYKCEPEKNKTCRKFNCYIYGGPCSRTTEKQYKKRFWRK